MHHGKLNLYIYIHIQISRARSADHRNIKMSAKWIARTPPKRQVEGSNPSGPGPNILLIRSILAQ
jgi:hypothetical protein